MTVFKSTHANGERNHFLIYLFFSTPHLKNVAVYVTELFLFQIYKLRLGG